MFLQKVKRVTEVAFINLNKFGNVFDIVKYCTFALIAGVYIYVASNNLIVLLSDSFDFYKRAEVIFNFQLKDMVNGLHPLGYPMLLKIVFFIAHDYVYSSKIISFVFSLVCLIYFYRICNFFFPRVISLLSTVILAFNPTYMYLSVSDCTDIACLSLSYLSIYFFIKATKYENYQKWYLISAVILGISYLMRYQSLTILPAMLAYLLFFEQRASIAKRKDLILIFVAGFCITAGIQLVSSYLYKGTPFWTIQYANIWFGIHGDFAHWGEHWEKARSYTGIVQIIAESPDKFFNHCKRNLIIIYTENMAEIPFVPLSIIGAMSLLFVKKNVKVGLFLLAIFLTYTFALSMTLVMSRYLIPVIPIWIFLVTAGIYFIFSFEILKLKKNQIYFQIAVLLIIINMVYNKNIKNQLRFPATYLTDDVHDVNMYFEKINVNNSDKIMSIGLDYHSLKHPLKNRYFNPRYNEQESFNSILQSPEQTANYMKLNNFDFLIFDRETSVWFPFIYQFRSNGDFNKFFTILYSRKGVEIIKIN